MNKDTGTGVSDVGHVCGPRITWKDSKDDALKDGKVAVGKDDIGKVPVCLERYVETA